MREDKSTQGCWERGGGVSPCCWVHSDRFPAMVKGSVMGFCPLGDGQRIRSSNEPKCSWNRQQTNSPKSWLQCCGFTSRWNRYTRASGSVQLGAVSAEALCVASSWFVRRVPWATRPDLEVGADRWHLRARQPGTGEELRARDEVRRRSGNEATSIQEVWTHRLDRGNCAYVEGVLIWFVFCADGAGRLVQALWIGHFK